MSAAVLTPKKIWTEEELCALPSDEYSYELVDGELVMSPKNTSIHSVVCGRLYVQLQAFVIGGRMGSVYGPEMGFWMSNRNCRAPDVSYVSRQRMIDAGFKPLAARFFPGAPNLAVEVLSEGNSRREMDGKIKDYFESGSLLVWLIDPDARRAEICRSSIQRRLIGNGGFLDGEDVLPGFRHCLSDLFKEWDWD